MEKRHFCTLLLALLAMLPVTAQISTFKKDGTNVIHTVERMYFNDNGSGLFSIAESQTAYSASDEVSLYDSLSIHKPHLTIPDAIFKAYLIAHYDSDADGGISIDEAKAVTGALSVRGLGITTLDGIQYFTNITSLDCGANKLDTLNLTSDTLLTSLTCDANHIVSLNLSRNTKLTAAYVGNQTNAAGTATKITINKGTLVTSVFPDLNVQGKANYMVKFTTTDGFSPGIGGWDDSGGDDGGSAE
jgi:hypothetical protein